MTTATPSIFTRNHLIRDAIGQALYDAMSSDASIHLFGEGAEVKMHYDAPKIEADFSDCVHTMPISEDGNTNFAVGAALMGVKPVVDVISADFLYRTMDSIANTAAKLDFVTGRDHTIVIRAEFLIGGPSTGQRPEALFTHIPGLRVVIPPTPKHAYRLMLQALATPGVTLFFEDRMIEDDVEDLDMPVPLMPRPKATIITYGLMAQRTRRVLRAHPMPIELFEATTIYPFAWIPLKDTAGRTKKLLIIEPDVTYGGVGAEIAARIAEDMPYVRIKRMGAPRETVPASMSLHGEMLLSEEQIYDGISNFINY